MARKLSRREMLRLLGLAGAGVLAGCATPETIVETVEKTVEVEKVVEVEKTVEVEVETVVTATPSPDGPKVITYVDSAGFGVPQYKESINPIAQALSEKMQAEGVNLELRVLLLDNAVDEYPLLYASGADFTFAFDAPWKNMNALRDQGYLRPLDNLIGDYPNIVEAITPEVIEYNYMLGHLYGLPTGFYLNGTGAGNIIYRQDLAEKYGMYPLKNMDELEIFFDEVLANEPGMIPFAADPTFNGFYQSGWWDWYQPEEYPLKMGYNPGNAMIGGGIEDIVRDQLGYVDSEDTDDFRSKADRARRWWEKGYVNKNMLQLLEVNAFDEFFNPGKAAAMGYNEGILKAKMLIQPALQAYVPEGKAAGLDQMEAREGGWISWAAYKQWNFQVFNNNSALDDTRAGLEFFDWLLADQDNIDIWLMGIDGVNYIKHPDMRYEDIEGVDGTVNYRRRWYVAGVPGKFERVPVDASDLYMEVLEYITTPANHLPNPLELFEHDRKVVETELAQMDAAAKEAVLPLNAGQIDVDQGLAAYKSSLDAAGRQEVKAVFQEQLDTWITENEAQFTEQLDRAKTMYEEWETGKHADWLASRQG